MLEKHPLSSHMNLPLWQVRCGIYLWPLGSFVETRPHQVSNPGALQTKQLGKQTKRTLVQNLHFTATRRLKCPIQFGHVWQCLAKEDIISKGFWHRQAGLSPFVAGMTLAGSLSMPILVLTFMWMILDEQNPPFGWQSHAKPFHMEVLLIKSLHYAPSWCRIVVPTPPGGRNLVGGCGQDSILFQPISHFN